jgi:enoyl-CoA hydratase/carnithine racemase
MNKPWRDALLEAAKAENGEFSVRVRSADTKEAITAFFEKRPPDFTWSRKAAVA